MADNQIEVDFKVNNADLDAGLHQAAQEFAATSATIQQSFAGLADQARKGVPSLESFAQALTDTAPSQTERKAEEDLYAAEVAHVQELRSLYQISAGQAIAEQVEIENEKFKRLSNELAAENNAANATIATHQRVQNELDALELRHDATRRQLNQKEISETMQAWQQMLGPISNAFSSSLSGMITGQENFRQALANIGNAIVSDFVNMAVKRATNWIASELTMTSATEAGNAARLASQTTADAAGKTAQATAGSVSVFGDANKAAAGAFSAVAGIPIVGPILAPAAAVAAFTAVMAYDVFSAEGGFDIPAGLNPMTQLHEREMVLPASIAEPLRSGLAGNNRQGGDIHIHAVDAASFQRLLLNNKSALAKALRGAHRTFDPALA